MSIDILSSDLNSKLEKCKMLVKTLHKHIYTETIPSIEDDDDFGFSAPVSTFRLIQHKNDNPDIGATFKRLHDALVGISKSSWKHILPGTGNVSNHTSSPVLFDWYNNDHDGLIGGLAEVLYLFLVLFDQKNVWDIVSAKIRDGVILLETTIQNIERKMKNEDTMTKVVFGDVLVLQYRKIQEIFAFLYAKYLSVLSNMMYLIETPGDKDELFALYNKANEIAIGNPADLITYPLLSISIVMSEHIEKKN